MTHLPPQQPYVFLLHQKRDLEQVWRDNVLAVAEYFAKHGKFPSQVASNTDDKRLGEFLSAQRKQANGSRDAHRLSHVRRAFLDEHLPGWQSDQEQEWRDKVIAAAAFVAENGRLPSKQGTQVGEKRAGVFLSTQRGYANGGKHAHLLTLERRAFLDEHLPSWHLDREQAWRDKVLSAATHTVEHGAFPSMTGADALERRLGKFLSTQRMQANGGKHAHLLTPERRVFLDEHLPGWLPDHEQAWRDKALAVAAFVAVQGRFPSSMKLDPDERRLGVFLHNQRSRANGTKGVHLLTPERRAFIDERLPGWL